MMKLTKLNIVALLAGNRHHELFVLGILIADQIIYSSSPGDSPAVVEDGDPETPGANFVLLVDSAGAAKTLRSANLDGWVKRWHVNHG